MVNLPPAKEEKKRQDNMAYARSSTFSTYNTVLGYYQAASCIEHARGDSCLDLACGDGILTSMLSPRFKRIVGVDASAKHLANARKLLPDAELHESLIEDLDIDEKFDSVFMLNILEHVIDPVETLKKAAGFLKPDGILIVHVPNAEAINRKIAVLMGTLTDCEELSPYDKNVAGHRRSYTLETLVNDLQAAGQTIVSTGGVFYKMLSTPQMDWFLKNGLWEEGGFGWGRVGSQPRDWKAEFCRACYEIGKERPRDCNIIYVCTVKES